MKKGIFSPYDPKKVREQLGLNQTEFWNSLGVTQHSGSRYENGRFMPVPIHDLFKMVYIDGIDTSQLRRIDFTILDYLKEQRPDLYEKLKKRVESHRDSTRKHVPPGGG